VPLAEFDAKLRIRKYFIAHNNVMQKVISECSAHSQYAEQRPVRIARQVITACVACMS
jgi:hypothetical protein